MLKELFPKKFRVKVCHYTQDKHTVDYCHYRFIPNWRSLHFWFEQTLTGGTECWSLNLWDVDHAEKVAMSLKSIEDVKKYYENDEKRESDFYRRKKEYYNKSVPYSTKEFK